MFVRKSVFNKKIDELKKQIKDLVDLNRYRDDLLEAIKKIEQLDETRWYRYEVSLEGPYVIQYTQMDPFSAKAFDRGDLHTLIRDLKASKYDSSKKKK